MRRYSVSRAAAVTRDLDLTEEHLVQVYQELGDDLDDAVERAAARIDDALAYMRTFVSHPHRGAEQKSIQPGVRSVTSRRFVLYFEIDEPSSAVRVLAVFFGGSDHRRQILERFRH